jgi:hypothetical protein
MFQTKVVEKIKTPVLCSITFFFFFENRAVYEIMRKMYGRAGHATDDNIIRRMRFSY